MYLKFFVNGEKLKEIVCEDRLRKGDVFTFEEKKYEVIDVELSFKSVAKTYPYYEMHQDVFLEPK